MNLFDAVCPECGLTFEVLFSQNPEFRDPEMCPECGFEFMPPGSSLSPIPADADWGSRSGPFSPAS